MRLAVFFLVFLGLILSAIEGLRALVSIYFIRFMFKEKLGTNIDLLFGYSLNANYLIEKFSWDYVFTFLLILLIVLTTVSLVLGSISSLYVRKVQLKFMQKLRTRLYDKITSFDLSFFDKAKSGELLFMVNTEVSRLSKLVLTFGSFISSGISCIVLLIIMFSISWQYSVFFSILSIAFVLPQLRLSKKIRLLGWQVNKSQNVLQQVFYNIIYGIKLIKVANLQSRKRDEYLKFHKKFEKDSVVEIKLQVLSSLIKECGFTAVLVILIFTVLYLSNHNSIQWSQASMLSFIFILMRLSPVVSAIQRALMDVLESYGPLRNISSLILNNSYSSPERHSTTVTDFPLASIKDIRLQNVSFTYPTKKKSVLSGVNLELKRGKMYGLVGTSGVGKSTLLDLISGLIKTTEGEILINGVNSYLLNPGKIKEKIGYVNQEPIIFHDTIMNNICFFNEDYNQFKIDEILERACIKDFVASLPQGLNTEVGERGLTLSGGERQRIGLARVLMKSHDLLLLDEATNALDYKTERYIFDNLRAMKNEKITLVVAHRLSSLANFDHIFFIHKGEIIETGTHHELLSRRDKYYNLYMYQANQ